MAIQPRGTGEIHVDVIDSKAGGELDVACNVAVASAKRLRERIASATPSGTIQSTATVLVEAVSVCSPTDMTNRAVRLPAVSSYASGTIWTVINAGTVTLRVFVPTGDAFPSSETVHLLQPEEAARYVYDGSLWRVC